MKLNTTTLFVGMFISLKYILTVGILLTSIDSGGTTGPVVAARLAENLSVSVLLIEAGQHNSLLENTQMVGGYVPLTCVLFI
jgi:GMC oxidoreductase